MSNTDPNRSQAEMAAIAESIAAEMGWPHEQRRYRQKSHIRDERFYDDGVSKRRRA